MLTTFPRVKDIFSCFKQYPSNFTAIFTFWIKVSFGAKLLFAVTAIVILSSDNFLDFHAKFYWNNH